MPEPIGGSSITGAGSLPPRRVLNSGDHTGKADFSKQLWSALYEVNQLQREADRLAVNFVSGEMDDLHLLMIKTEEARLSLQTTVQVTNKVIDAYREILRMQL